MLCSRSAMRSPPVGWTMPYRARRKKNTANRSLKWEEGTSGITSRHPWYNADGSDSSELLSHSRLSKSFTSTHARSSSPPTFRHMTTSRPWLHSFRFRRSTHLSIISLSSSEKSQQNFLPELFAALLSYTQVSTRRSCLTSWMSMKKR